MDIRCSYSTTVISNVLIAGAVGRCSNVVGSVIIAETNLMLGCSGGWWWSVM